MSATVNVPSVEVSNFELVSRVLQSHAGYFRKQLLAYGVAPFELEDAYSEVCVQALRFAPTFDPARGHIKSWIGYSIVRTVACNIYGAKRPAWRKAADLEAVMALGYDVPDADADGEAPTALAAQAAEGADPAAMVAAAQFAAALERELDEREQAVLAVEGLGVLHQRISSVAAQAHCDALQLTPTGLRNLVTRLRSKACSVATEHFGADALKGRPAGPKPVRRQVAFACA